MKTFCFLNNKGGVGKTATVSTVSHILATKHKKKVLIVDVDPQGNTSTRFSDKEWVNIFISIYKGEKWEEKAKTVEDILLDRNLDPHEAVQHTAYKNIDIIPSYLTLSTCEEHLKADVAMPQQFNLKNQLLKLKDEYDYCLIDCSPSISILNVNALVASDEVYLPVRTDGDSCLGLAISMNLIEDVRSYNISLKIGGVFLTQVNWQEGVAKSTYEFLKQVLPPGMLIPIQIGSSKYLKETSFEQKPLLAIDNKKEKSSVTNAYLLLTEYLIADNKEVFIKKNKKKIMSLPNLLTEE